MDSGSTEINLPYKKVITKNNDDNQLNLVITPYHEHFSERIKELDSAAEMSKFFFGLIEFGKFYQGAYHNKCEKYDAYSILLCQNILSPKKYNIQDFDKKQQKPEDPLTINLNEKEEDGIEVLGVVCISYKQLFYKYAPKKFGYITDLRVHKKGHRLGIGNAQMNEVETVASLNQVDILYLSVNGDLYKAVRLYLKMGYTICSQRKLGFYINTEKLAKKIVERKNLLAQQDINYEGVAGDKDKKSLIKFDNGQSFWKSLFNPYNEPKNLVVKEYGITDIFEIEEKLLQAHKMVDFAPTSQNPILKKQNYLGAVIVYEKLETNRDESITKIPEQKDQKIIGGCYLIKNYRNGSMTAKRIIVPPEDLNKTSVMINCYLLIYSLPMLLGYGFTQMLNLQGFYFWSFLLISLIVSLCLNFLFEKLRFVIQHAGADNMARLAGGFVLTKDIKKIKQVQEILVNHSACIARENGIEILRTNYDKRVDGNSLEKFDGIENIELTQANQAQKVFFSYE